MVRLIRDQRAGASRARLSPRIVSRGTIWAGFEVSVGNTSLLVPLQFNRAVQNMATSAACNRTGQTMKIGPFAFWVISPFGGVQLWTYYCILNASGLPAIAVELSC
jgi:hypothetical protein